MLHSIAVVLGGFVVMAIVVMTGTMAAAAALIPGGLASMRAGPGGPLPSSYLAANLAVSFLAAVLAGWLVARFAVNHPGAHVLALGGLLLAMGVVSAVTTRGAAVQPRWYVWVIPLVGVAGIAAGWALRVTVS